MPPSTLPTPRLPSGDEPPDIDTWKPLAAAGGRYGLVVGMRERGEPEEANENLRVDRRVRPRTAHGAERNSAVDVHRREAPPVGKDLFGVLPMTLGDDRCAPVEKPPIRDHLPRQSLQRVSLGLDLEPIHSAADHCDIGALVGDRDPQLVRMRPISPACAAEIHASPSLASRIRNLLR
jgi:hypothetical protein